MSNIKNNIRTTCPYCGVGCGVIVSQTKAGEVQVNGDPLHPANFGRLCTKGRLLNETLSDETRIGNVYVNGEPTSWSKSVAYVASKMQQTIDTFGADSIALYVSGQLLTEDYYVANKFAKGFLGTSNIDTNSRLCMSSPVVAHKKAFGSDCVPVSYSDLESADLIILVGSNLAWCHPVLHQRIRAAKEARPDRQVVVIDPRRTASCELADFHLPIKSGTDLLLFNGLLSYLYDQGHATKDFFNPHGLAKTLKAAKDDFKNIDDLATQTGIEPSVLMTFFQLFANQEKVVTIYSQGINQSEKAVDQCSAIINCHLLTNRIGRPGMGPFSITGQPNAMGGREVGAMATSLAAHLDFGDEKAHRLVSDFWQTNKLPNKNGTTAVDIFDQIEKGKIKAIWIMATNPAVTLPNSYKIKDALDKCPLVIVSESFTTSETIKYANVVFPAQPWGEKSGTVTNAERRISRQRAFREPYESAKPDWWIICQVAKAMGFAKSFDYQSTSEIFQEHAALSCKAAAISKSFNLSAVSALNSEQYDNLSPFQWPQKKTSTIELQNVRLFQNGNFHTKDGRPVMVPVSFASNGGYRLTDNLFVLNSGRTRDQWHTMTRSGMSENLNLHSLEPLVILNPADAERELVKNKQIIRLTNEHGELILRASISEQVPQGHLFVSMHWSNANSHFISVNQLVGDSRDPQSKQPAFKQASANIAPADIVSEAVLLCRYPLNLDEFSYWTVQKVKQGYLYFVACKSTTEYLHMRLSEILGKNQRLETGLQVFNAQDADASRFSVLTLQGRNVQWYLQTYKPLTAININCLPQALEQNVMPGTLNGIMSDQPLRQLAQPSPICLCMKITRESIESAIDVNSTNPLAAVCESTGAGKACGSCLGDIEMVINGR